MITTLDAETTMFPRDPREGGSPSPYLDNFLVSIGYAVDACDPKYFCFNHNDEPPTKDGKAQIQKVLDATELLIGHNLKFDIQWLWECGFKYDGAIHDTMVYEYLQNHGKNVSLRLHDCCIRRGLEGKIDLAQKYLEEGLGFEAMPWEVVKTYGLQDITETRQLAHLQFENLREH